ncbi:MAG TPA: hypothetical protein VGS19_38185 [Streptosporangiaceae bacterium]|nr:hypothetical protein [Streptosporangiaceae bacterium]
MLTSRSTGWVVAAALTGAVVALAVVDATAPSATPAGFTRTFVPAPANVHLRGLPPGLLQPGQSLSIAPPGTLPAEALLPGHTSISIGPGGRYYVGPAGSQFFIKGGPPPMARQYFPGAIQVLPRAGLPAPLLGRLPALLGPPAGIPGAFAQAGEAVYGTVQSTSASSLTIKLHGGQTVTVDKTSSTKYLDLAGSSWASSVTRGATVVVVGTPNGAAVNATQVVVVPTVYTKLSQVTTP